MLTEKEKSMILKRIDAVIVSGAFSTKVCDNLQDEWIALMQETSERASKESKFQKDLISLENTIDYLRMRHKI